MAQISKLLPSFLYIYKHHHIILTSFAQFIQAFCTTHHASARIFHAHRAHAPISGNQHSACSLIHHTQSKARQHAIPHGKHTAIIIARHPRHHHGEFAIIATNSLTSRHICHQHGAFAISTAYMPSAQRECYHKTEAMPRLIQMRHPQPTRGLAVYMREPNENPSRRQLPDQHCDIHGAHAIKSALKRCTATRRKTTNSKSSQPSPFPRPLLQILNARFSCSSSSTFPRGCHQVDLGEGAVT